MINEINKRNKVQNEVKQFLFWLESVDVSQIKYYDKLCFYIRKIDSITRYEKRAFLEQEIIERLLICRKVLQDRQDEIRFGDSLNLR